MGVFMIKMFVYYDKDDQTPNPLVRHALSEKNVEIRWTFHIH